MTIPERDSVSSAGVPSISFFLLRCCSYGAGLHVFAKTHFENSSYTKYAIFPCVGLPFNTSGKSKLLPLLLLIAKRISSTFRHEKKPNPPALFHRFI